MATWLRQAPPFVVAALLVVAACSSNDSDGSEGESSASTTLGGSEQSETTSGNSSPSAADTESGGDAPYSVLPTRSGPRRETTHAVPHIQTDAVLVPELDAELRRRAFSLPGVENRLSELSLGAARSLWLADELDLQRPEILRSGREFAHFHPDGSLHVWMPVERAIEVATTKWGELHPWVGREDFWDGLVMIYTPETPEHVDVSMLLIVDAYNYVTGASLDPSDFD